MTIKKPDDVGLFDYLLFYVYLAHRHGFKGGKVGFGCNSRATGAVHTDLGIGEGCTFHEPAGI